MAKNTTDPAKPAWFDVRLGDEQLKAWANYFQAHLHFLPYGLKLLADKKITLFLVPCEWPEWFDPAYAPPQKLPAWPAREFFAPPTIEQRERVGAMLGQFMVTRRMAEGQRRDAERAHRRGERRGRPLSGDGPMTAEDLRATPELERIMAERTGFTARQTDGLREAGE